MPTSIIKMVEKKNLWKEVGLHPYFPRFLHYHTVRLSLHFDVPSNQYSPVCLSALFIAYFLNIKNHDLMK